MFLSFHVENIFSKWIIIFYRKKAPVSLTSMMNMAKTKSKMAKEARENMQIKVGD